MLLRLLQVALAAAAARAAGGDARYRLDPAVTPLRYEITVTPYFDTGDERAFTFDGRVSVLFVPREDVERVTLHSEGLAFAASDVTVSAGSSPVRLAAAAPLRFDEKYALVSVNLRTGLRAGAEYVLNVTYRGPLREDLHGFYRGHYVENGVKKWWAATQFSQTHARKAFPCFDEPALRAVFSLAVRRPARWRPSLANGALLSSRPLSNGYVMEKFHPTPKMSTYLVGFLVSELEPAASTAVESKRFAVYTRPDAKNQTEYVFDFGRRVLDALGDYFGIDYYSVDDNLKLHHVALADFKFSGMENWGLIKYREAMILYVPEHSNPYYRYRACQLVAHETTHMWFGNLVTCHWWSDTWLKEGFANYFQDYITSLVEPEVGSAGVQVTGSVYSAYDADDFPESPPISNDRVNSPDEIADHFGTVSYQKAGSVVRMMHHLMGDDAFRHGLRSYLEDNKFQAAHPEHLYEGLEKGATAHGSLTKYPETRITDVMSSWITRAGHPLVFVDVNREHFTVTLTQKRFYINASHDSDELYKIPITYTVGNDPDFDDTKPAFIMHGKTHIFNVPETTEPLGWVILNIQETGLYRVNYDSETWNLITAELKGHRREEIHHLNRAKIVNDLFALFYSDEVSFDLLHEVLGFLTDETDYFVWSAAIKGFNKLRKSYLGTDTLRVIEKYALEVTENIIAELGYAVEDGDGFLTQWNRMQVMEFACKLGHEGCQRNMITLYKDLKEQGREMSPSLRPAAYCAGLRRGDGADFDFLWGRATTALVANEARLISELMGCSADEGRVRRYLFSMLIENGPIKTQDLTVPLKSVLANYDHVNVVLEELQKNVTLWTSTFTAFDTVLDTIAAELHTEREFETFESWLAACAQCSEKAVTAAHKSVAKARAATEWAENHKAAILKTLDK